jgi:ABC-2 type transport system permease protein
MRAFMGSLIRTSAFLRKEIVEVVRQPRLLVMLVLGPFLILLVFGTGLREQDPAVRTTFVVDPQSLIAAQIERFAEAQDQRLDVRGLTHDREGALNDLREGSLDLVVVVPDDAVDRIRSDVHAEVTAYHDQLDPIESQAIGLFTRTAVDEINQLVLQRLVDESQSDAEQVRQRVDVAQRSAESLERSSSPEEVRRAQRDLSALALVVGPTAALLRELGGGRDDGLLQAITGLDESAAGLSSTPDGPRNDQIGQVQQDLEVIESGLAEYQELSPSTIVSPFEGVSRRVVPTEVRLQDYYAPAVVVLLLQHLVVTFVALSLVRERTIGATELFQVTPMRPFEILVGKYVAYVVLGGALATVLIAALVFALGVPLAGSVLAVAAVVALVLAASIGVGFLMALVSDSDSQAVQYAMLLLLASIFFTGFLLSLERFRAWITWIALPIPAARGVSALRDLMLRGTELTTGTVLHLGVLALVFFVLSWILLARRLSSS